MSNRLKKENQTKFKELQTQSLVNVGYLSTTNSKIGTGTIDQQWNAVLWKLG